MKLIFDILLYEQERFNEHRYQFIPSENNNSTWFDSFAPRISIEELSQSAQSQNCGQPGLIHSTKKPVAPTDEELYLYLQSQHHQQSIPSSQQSHQHSEPTHKPTRGAPRRFTGPEWDNLSKEEYNRKSAQMRSKEQYLKRKTLPQHHPSSSISTPSQHPQSQLPHNIPPHLEKAYNELKALGLL